VLVNYLREFQMAAGVPRDEAYDLTMYILAGLLIVALLANEMVKPLASHVFIADKEGAPLREGSPAGGRGRGARSDLESRSFDARVAMAWAAVTVPCSGACGSRCRARWSCSVEQVPHVADAPVPARAAHRKARHLMYLKDDRSECTKIALN
jgi:hypothetical protein